MIYTNLTRKAIKLIYEKHSGQVDKSGLPYVFHPFHVAESMDDELSTTVALLHDIVEDTNTTYDDLLNEGFSEEVIDILKLLTHDKVNVNYEEYINNIASNEVATKVKLSDLKHNSDLSRLEVVTDRDIERVNKYKKYIEYLTNIELNRNNK